MKILKLLFILTIMFNNFCFTQTENWKILTLQRELYSINFLTQSNVQVFAGDYSYRSFDGGVTWTTPFKNSKNIGISGGSYYTYPNHIFFIDSLYGWVTQASDTLVKTTNGGINWLTINTNLNGSGFVCIQFINRQLGFIAGGSGNLGVVSKTTNGGINWIVCTNTLKKPISSLYMINSLKGFASSFSNDTIAQTTDGWNSFEYKKAGNGQRINKIFFIDSLQGWLLGNPGFISRTTNGGLNWDVYTVSLGNTVNMFFVNSSTGWVTSTRKRIFKTTNGGINWFNQLSAGNSDSEVFRDIYFKNINTGWALGTSSNLLKTTNGGNNWEDTFKNPDGDLRAVQFINVNTGWCAGSKGLYKTTDRGYSWMSIQSFLNLNINSIFFINENTGFLCRDSGVVNKTTNGGINWISQSIGTFSYKKITFINNNTGYLCGASGTILKTINSGINWINQQSDLSYTLNDVTFTDPQNGYIAADNGYILKTTNGGENWISSFPHNNFNYSALHFVNSNTGIALGNKFSGTGGSGRYILRTTDSGITWSHTNTESYYGPYLYTDVFFINEQTGWLTSSDFYKGYISKTTNGGVSWFQSFGPIGSSTGPHGGLFNISALNENNIWIAGDNGSIISPVSPIGIQIISTEVPKVFLLSQNYPNPFNPKTKIKFAVPSNVKGQTSNVKLIIYDLLGREVSTPVNEELKPGTYEADWDGSNYSSGVYFYKIITEGFVETKKMVLMK